MPAVELTDIPDLVATTLRHLGRNKFQQIAQRLQTYQVVSRWLKKDKVQFDNGIGIQRTLMNTLSRQARHVGVTHSVSVDIPTLLDQLQINWRHAHVPWSFTYHEILVNSGESMILNVLKPRRVDAMLSMAEELEAKAWSVPAVGNKTEPYGIPYWIVYNGTTGFNGGAPSGYTTVGGVDLTDSPTFKNYTAQYTTANKADLIKKMRAGHRKCRWISPVSNQDYRKEEYADFRLYTDSTTIAEMEDIGEGQNENLGRDLAPFGVSNDVKYTDGTLLFRKSPIIGVDQLDDTAVYTAATNPVYMIDHSTFYPVCLVGDFMRESKPIQLQNQPQVFRVDIWLTYNFLCVDRRRNALFAKS
jgi:hypothetical protein